MDDTLQGQVSKTAAPSNFYDVIDQNPQRYAALNDTQKRALADDFFNKRVATQQGFDKLEPQKQAAVKQDFYQKYQIPKEADLMDHIDPTQRMASQMMANDQQFANDHPILSGIGDVLTGHALGRGLLQGITAGGYTPGVGGNLPSNIANTVLGAPVNNPVSNAIQGFGQMAGGFLGAAGTAPVLGPAGAGALYFGNQNLNQQLDQGRNLQSINYPHLMGQTALGAATGVIPGAVGNSLPTKLATGALMGGGINAIGTGIDQLAEEGKIDPRDPRYMQAILSGLGPGAAGGLFHQSPATHSNEPPIGLSQLKEQPVLQGKVEKTQPWGLDKQGQRTLSRAFDKSRKTRYEELTQQRKLRSEIKQAAGKPTMSMEQYYDHQAENLYNKDTSAKKSAYNAAKTFHGNVRKRVLKRQMSREYNPTDKQQESIALHEAMERLENRMAEKKKNEAAIQQAKARTEKRIESETKKTQKKQSDALKEDIQNRSKQQQAEEKDADVLMGAIRQATKVPEPKESKQIDHQAAGPDEYSKMAKNAKEYANEQKRQAKQQKREQSAQGQEKTKSPDQQKPVSVQKRQAQLIERHPNFKTAPQETHPTAKQLTAVLKNENAKNAYDKLPQKTKKAMAELDEAAKAGNRAEIYDYEPKTGQLSSNETGINVEGGKKDKLVTPLGWEYNHRSGEFKLHALNHNFEHRTYVMQKARSPVGLSNVVVTEKPGLVGKYHNSYFKPGQHVPLSQHLETAVGKLPQSDITRILQAEGDVTKIPGGTRKRLRDVLKRAGVKQEEAYNYVQEILSNPHKIDAYIEERLPDKLVKNLKSGNRKVDFIKTSTEFAKQDPLLRKIVNAAGDCLHGKK